MEVGKNARFRFKLNGVTVNAPLDWQTISISATFEDNEAQPSISISEIDFVGEAKEVVENWENDIFQGLPFDIEAYNKNQTISVFKGYLDLTEGYQLIEDNYGVIRLRAKIVKQDGLNSLSERIEGVSFSYLYTLGLITESECEYLVEKESDLIEIIMLKFSLFIMIKEAAENTKNLAETIADVIGLATGGGPINGQASSIVLGIAKALILTAYLATVSIAIANLGKDIIENFISPIRKHKVTSWYNLLDAIANHLGYNLVTPLSELKNIYYLPSNRETDKRDLSTGFISIEQGVKKGIPQVGESGYLCGEFVENLKKLFNARFAVIGNDLHFRTKSDPFFQNIANYTLPIVAVRNVEYNTVDFKANFLANFVYDSQDFWTIEDDTDISIQMVTEPTNVYNQKMNLAKGLDEISIGWALGSRKNELNGLERLLKSVSKVIDQTTGILGGGTNLESKIKKRIGMLKVGKNNHSVPKALYLQGGKLPKNHRDLLSMRYFYENYLSYRVFTTDNFAAQKKIFTGNRIPFGMEDFIKVINNSYTTNGEKMLRLEWTIDGDFATCDYEKQYAYTTNLQTKEIN